MFEPPRCPYPHCLQHAQPSPGFFVRHGSYRAKCRPHTVPRFRCRTCGRTFSRQSFRMSFGDHRPHLNAALFELLCSGIGLRQSARVLRLSRRCTELKFRKIARHLRRLNLNLRCPLPKGSTFQFDEFETYEGRRNTRPLSVPMLIERESRYLIWAESATIRPRGKMTKSRLEVIAAEDRRLGRRTDRSRRAIRRTLHRGAELSSCLPSIVLHTDEKSSYPGLAREAFGARRLLHHRTNSKVSRDKANLLFPINHAEAMSRDLMGRLRRESWLVSKKRRCLDLALQLYAAYRNYVRRRFNWDTQSAAQVLGFVSRRLSFGEALSWRQDWEDRSIHPLAKRCESVAWWRHSMAPAA